MRHDAIEFEKLLEAHLQAETPVEVRFSPLAGYRDNSIQIDTVLMAILVVAVACWFI